MSIEELLRDCYLNNKDIHINLEISKSIQLEDVFTIVYLVDIKGLSIKFDDDLAEFMDIDDSMFHCEGEFLPVLEISIEIENPDIIVMLYLISKNDKKRYHPVPFHSDCRIDNPYKDKKRFIKLAKDASVINYYTVRKIMDIFGIKYHCKTDDTKLFVEKHLGLLNNTKSARNI